MHNGGGGCHCPVELQLRRLPECPPPTGKYPSSQATQMSVRAGYGPPSGKLVHFWSTLPCTGDGSGQIAALFPCAKII